jgi:DNA-binding response OmpR family regulator
MARVLVVDDSTVCLRIVCEALRAAGHEVDQAADGKHGLALFRRTPPALVISDVVMPEMDGFELLWAIRALAPETPLILMSGGTHSLRVDDLLRTAKVFGAWQVIPKPFTGEELLRAVKRALAPAGSPRVPGD